VARDGSNPDPNAYNIIHLSRDPLPSANGAAAAQQPERERVTMASTFRLKTLPAVPLCEQGRMWVLTKGASPEARAVVDALLQAGVDVMVVDSEATAGYFRERWATDGVQAFLTSKIELEGGGFSDVRSTILDHVCQLLATRECCLQCLHSFSYYSCMDLGKLRMLRKEEENYCLTTPQGLRVFH